LARGTFFFILKIFTEPKFHFSRKLHDILSINLCDFKNQNFFAEPIEKKTSKLEIQTEENFVFFWRILEIHSNKKHTFPFWLFCLDFRDFYLDFQDSSKKLIFFRLHFQEFCLESLNIHKKPKHNTGNPNKKEIFFLFGFSGLLSWVFNIFLFPGTIVQKILVYLYLLDYWDFRYGLKFTIIFVIFSFPRCDGKQSCEIFANSSTFGVPCPNSVHILEVIYACLKSNWV
jgi:hypothetical protein